MYRWLDRLVSFVWALFLALLILAAVYIVTGRYFFNSVGEYRSEIEVVLSQTLDVPITIDGLSGEWSPLLPKLSVSGFAIKPPNLSDDEHLKFANASITIDVISSLKRLSLVSRDLYVDGLNLTFERTSDGRFVVKGIKSKQESNIDAVISAVLLQQRMELSGSQFTYIDGAAARQLVLEKATASRVNGVNYLEGQVRLSAESDALLQLKARARADLETWRKSSASIYVSIDGEDISEWIPRKMLKGIQLDYATPKLKIWADIDEGFMRSVQGSIAFKDVKAQGVDGQLPDIRQLGARFFLKHETQKKWQLALNSIRWEQSDVSLSNGKLYAAISENVNGEKEIDLQISELEISPLINVLLQSTVLNEKLREVVANTKPSVRLTDVAAHVTLIPEAPVPTFSLSLDFEDLNVSTWEKVPGLSGFSGRLFTTSKSGVLEVSGENAEFDWPHFMPEPIAGEFPSNVVGWTFEDGSVHFETGAVVVKVKESVLTKSQITDADKQENSDVKSQELLIASNSEKSVVSSLQPIGSLMASITVPLKDKSAKPYLELVSSVIDGDIEDVRKYLPVTVPQQVSDWLSSALKGGQLLEGSFVYNGEVRGFDSNFNERTFQMRFIADQARVQFLDGWPALDDGIVDVTTDILGYTEIDIVQGKIYESDVIQGNLRISYPPSIAEGVDLDFQGVVKGPASDGMKILQDTPLSETLGDFIRELKVSGDMDLSLDVAMPLVSGMNKPVQPKILATVGVSGSVLTIPSVELQLQDIDGVIEFSSIKGLTSDSFNARWMGFPVHGSIDSVSAASSPNSTVSEWLSTSISFQGMTSFAALSRWNPQPVFDFFSGEFEYAANVAIHNQSTDSKQTNTLQVQSNLSQVAIDLPFPYGKKSGEPRDLDFRISLTDPAEEPLKIDFLYNKFLAASLFVDDKGIERAHFLPGRDSWIPYATKPGIFVDGYIEAIDFDEWVEFFGVIAEKYSAKNNEAQDSNAGNGSERDIYESIGRIRLHTDLFTGFGGKLQDLDVIASFENEQWLIDLATPELEALIEVPQRYSDQAPDFKQLNPWSGFSDTPINVDVKYLQVPSDPLFFINEDTAEQGVTSQVSVAALNTAAQASAVNEIQPEPEFSPNWVPPIKLTLHKLFLADDDWGQWRADVLPLQSGLRISNVVAEFNNLELKGDGFWVSDFDIHEFSAKSVSVSDSTSGLALNPDQKLKSSISSEATTNPDRSPATSTSSDNTSTNFSGSVSLANIADVIDALGYEPTLKSQSGSAQLKLNWRGSPVEFSLETLQGDVGINLNNGFITSVDSAASSVKVLGLLNFEKLLDRLQLDFKDVYEKGLAFNTISGQLSFDDAVLTNKNIKINGPSTQMEISGTLDLINSTIDQEVTLVLPISRNLILPAGVIGGLPGAATAFIVDKAFGDQLDKLSTIYFIMKGDIQDPSVSEVKFFR